MPSPLAAALIIGGVSLLCWYGYRRVLRRYRAELLPEPTKEAKRYSKPGAVP